MSQAFEALVKHVREITDLKGAESLLGWDQQVYMPKKGNDARSRQIALLSSITHQKLTDPRLGELIEQCQTDATLTEEQKVIVREVKRDYDRSVKVPTELVHEIAETAGKSHTVWANALETSDFGSFAPYLKKLVALKKREAEAIGFPKDGVPYDALLDAYEPGATVKKLNPIIDKTKAIVVPAVKALTEAKKQPDRSLLKRDFDVDGQEKFCAMLAAKMGYDLDAGRIDRSVHPFTTTFDLDDVRITTRYYKNWLPSSVFGTIHETGHALYEQGLNRKWRGTPLADARSLGVHESQSRLWENQIGRSLSFWKFFFPKLKKQFPETLKDVSLKDFHFAVNSVRGSYIRVEADEVTYNLHIVVRYEIEQAIFNDEVKVTELPTLWNDKMQAYIGVRPQNDAQGILQDIHWSFGGFGYFPTYLLGNLYAAQWMAAMRKHFPNLDEMMAKGELLPIREWLREKIHKHGRRYTADELAKKVTGETLNPKHFDTYLRERYQPLYKVTW